MAVPLVVLLAGCRPIATTQVVPTATSTAQPAPARTAVPRETGRHLPGVAPALQVSGVGAHNTPLFTVSDPSWQIHWAYDCSRFGKAGNFIMNAFSGDGYFVAKVLNRVGLRGSGVDQEYRAGTYSLQISSECSWHITVTE